MKLVIMVGARYIHNYDFLNLLDSKSVKLVILSGEYAINSNKNILEKYDIDYRVVKKYYHKDPRAERLIDEDLEDVIDGLIKSWIGGNVCLYCDDEIYLLQTAKMRALFKIDGPTELEMVKFRDKIIMKDHLLKNKIALPKFKPLKNYLNDRDKLSTYNTICHDLDSNMFIIKPTIMLGSTGFFKVNSPDDYHRFFYQHYVSDMEYMVEEFISGDLFHVDGIVENGKIKHLFICEYTIPNAEMVKGYVLGSIPIADFLPEYEVLENYALKIIEQVFAIKNSAFHMEVFYDRVDDKINFLEIAHRPPGAHVCKLYSLNYDFNIFNQHFTVSCGIISKIKTYEYNKITYTAGYIPIMEGVYGGIRTPNTLSSQFVYKERFKIGDHLPKAKNVGSIAAEFQLFNLNYKKLLKDFYLLRKQKLLLVSES